MATMIPASNKTKLPYARLKTMEDFFITFAGRIDFFDCIVTCMACLLTPVQVLIVREMELSSSITIALLLCDSFFFVKFWKNCMLKWRRPAMSSTTGTTKLVMSFITIIPLLVMPAIYYTARESSLVMWISVLRMMSFISFREQFETLKAFVEKNLFYVSSTMARIVLTVVFTILCSSLLACIWFYMADVEDENTSTWITNDEVLNLDSVNSKYFRSLHFVLSTLFTIG